MTTQFYVPADRIHGSRLSLPEDEARHASRALRLAAGDEIIVVDGSGGWYRVELDHVSGREAAGHVIEQRSEVGEPDYHLIMAVGLIKHRGRFETFLEKAVELGVSEIVPLISARTEKEGLREERAENILIAAMKQCGRSRMPTLREPTPLDEVIGGASGQRFCCHESADARSTLLSRLDVERRDGPITMLVGPEGGFSPEEVDSARAAGFAVVSLGSRRLRAETAAIVSAATVAMAYDSA